MLRESVADDLRADELAPGFVRPAWTEYCFANVPDTVRSLFGVDARRPLPDDALGADQVRLVAVDHQFVA